MCLHLLLWSTKSFSRFLYIYKRKEKRANGAKIKTSRRKRNAEWTWYFWRKSKRQLLCFLFINHFNTCDVRPTTSSPSLYSANIIIPVANGLQCCNLLRPLTHGCGFVCNAAIHIPRSIKFKIFSFFLSIFIAIANDKCTHLRAQIHSKEWKIIKPGS